MTLNFLSGGMPRSERYLSLLLAALVGYATISRAVIQLIQMVWQAPFHLDTLLRMGLLALLVLMALPKLLKRFPIGALLPALLIAWLLLLGWFRAPGSGDLFPRMLSHFLLQCTTAYWICSSVHPEEQTVRDLAFVGPLITVGLAIQLLVIRKMLAESYSQQAGYELLLAVVISLAQLFDPVARNRLLHLANVVLGIVLMLATGARGPVACAALFCLFLVLVSQRSKILKIVLLVSGVIFAILYFSGGFLSLLESLRDWMLEKDMSVRTITTLLNGDFFTDQSRAQLATHSWREILSHPLWGVGLGHDRLFLAPVLHASPDKIFGCYPHNLVLELLMHYGLVFGGALTVGLLVLFWKGCCQGEDTPPKKLAQMFFGFGVLPLFFSGSYLSSPLFFGWIALSLRAVHVQRHPNPYEQLFHRLSPAK